MKPLIEAALAAAVWTALFVWWLGPDWPWLWQAGTAVFTLCLVPGRVLGVLVRLGVVVAINVFIVTRTGLLDTLEHPMLVFGIGNALLLYLAIRKTPLRPSAAAAGMPCSQCLGSGSVYNGSMQRPNATRQCGACSGSGKRSY